MIVRQATSSLARKLASRLFIFKMSKRFVDAGSVDNFIAEQENKATLQKTQRDVRLLQTFLGTRNELRKVEEIPALESASLLFRPEPKMGKTTSLLRSEVYWQVLSDI